nr:hypothetical protein [Tanacetum cinerariifolium]
KLAALQSTREKQRKENESLKQMKLDIQPGRQVVRPKAIRYDEIQRLNSHFEVINERNDKFVLPDLNVPVGEDAIMSY